MTIFRWSARTTQEAVRLLDRVAREVKTRSLPGEIFEAHVRTYKKISTELVILKEGKIFLIRRPSKKNNPTDPYAGQWHIPGVLHNVQETSEQAYKRLLRQEIGKTVALGKPKLARTLEVKEPKRGLFYVLLYVVRVRSGTLSQGDSVGFFDPTHLPNPMVPFHKKILIPHAVEFIKK